MQNGTTGAVDAESPNLDDITNWALGNLSSGRTWYETIHFRNVNGIIDNTIDVPSWTILEGDANFTLDDNQDKTMLLIQSETQVIIDGLRLDGNENGQTADYRSAGISVEDSTYVTIKNVDVINAMRFGIAITYYGDFSPQSPDDSRGSAYCDVINCFVDGATWNGIYISFSDNCGIYDSRATGCSDVGIGTWNGRKSIISGCISYENLKNEGYSDSHWDFCVERNSSNILVTNCIAYGSDAGFKITGTNYDNWDISVVSCFAYDENQYSFSVGKTNNALFSACYGNGVTSAGYDMFMASATAENVTVVGMHLTNGVRDGMLISAPDVTITGITIENMGRHGIYINDNVVNTVIVGGRIGGCTNRSIFESDTGTGYNLIDGLNLRGNGQAHNVDSANSVIGDIRT